MIIDEETYLEHYGVKGMKWGIRRDRSGSREKRLTKEQKTKLKKAAIISGSLLVAAGTVYAGHTLAKNGKLPLSKTSSKSASTVGKKAAEAALVEPTSVVYSSRGKNMGFTILESGGTNKPIEVLERAGLTTGNEEAFKRLPDGSIGAHFFDMKGRTDRAGRRIPHSLVIPPVKAEGINTLDDVKKKVWPTLEKTYDDFYEKSLKEGF